MEENYIHIFCSFLAYSLVNKYVEKKDVMFLLKEFYPVCENIKNRQDLIVFVSKYSLNFTFLEELKSKLADKNFLFNF